MNKGALIRYYRIQKGLSQEDLANGLVSVSYLSRIENNQVKATNETLNLLFNRLGIEFKKLDLEQAKFRDLLIKWEEPLLYNNKEKSTSIYKKLQPYKEKIFSIELLMEYNIKLIRHFIIVNKLECIEKTLANLINFSNCLDPTSLFYYYKHIGNYYYVIGDYRKSEEYLNKAILGLNKETITQEELADVYYLISLTLSKLRKDSTAIDYAEKALKLYQEKYDIKRSAETHTQLGISYRRIQRFKTALKHYSIAMSLARKINNKLLLGRIEHNLSILQMKLGNYENALTHIENSLQYKKNSYNISYLSSIVSMVSILFELNKLEKCRKWTKHGLRLLKQQQKNNKEQKYQLYFYHKLLEDDIEEWELFVKRDFIPFLKRNQKWYLLTVYSKKFANYYQKKKMYKSATYYFKLSIEAYDQLYKI